MSENKMNERIKELAEQVDSEFNSPYDRHKAIERFAELIVRECIWALWTEECRTSDLASEEYTRGSKKIKEHFEVEEIMEDQPDEIEYCPTCGEEWSGTSCGALRCGWIEGNEE